MSQQLPYKLTLKIPFDSEPHANVVLQSLLPDKELRPDQVTRILSLEGPILVADYSAASDRVLRVTINALLDSVAMLVEAIDGLEDI
ncbi:uncharacterized protein SAPINGB_P006237 [Magnusiomyces paraingens]|uniref:Transcription factor Pcc1 n=1 Tax=Magnusiomyces paraingens TaxID=2606893 RepID=A0A5E8C3Y3_9ASCO|nr:uncharacterized protein SAPINGB_P006237 [Saprochaete ingens]VVT58494.1 unnamed protein product [Saprochaete ingens]